jgi:hypothetical protein
MSYVRLEVKEMKRAVEVATFKCKCALTALGHRAAWLEELADEAAVAPSPARSAAQRMPPRSPQIAPARAPSIRRVILLHAGAVATLSQDLL